MDQLMEIIKKRMSIRAYSEKTLSKETISSILEAAKHAPTARNLQQLEYKIITNRSLAKQLSEVITAQVSGGQLPFQTRADYFYNAPLVIIIAGPKNNGMIEADGGLAAQNIMLFATSLGLGSCFIGMAEFLEKDASTMKQLHIADDRKIVACVICGYANEKPAPKEKKLNAEFFE